MKSFTNSEVMQNFLKREVWKCGIFFFYLEKQTNQCKHCTLLLICFCMFVSVIIMTNDGMSYISSQQGFRFEFKV